MALRTAFYHEVEQVPIALTTADQSSAAFGSQSRWIRLCTDAVQGARTGVVRYVPGDGTPSTGTAYSILPPGAIEYIAVHPGQRVTARLVSGTGVNLSITELS